MQLRGELSPKKYQFVRILTCLETGCSIWCVELIRREILRQHPQAKVNAILIDFFLYDTIKEKEAEGVEIIPHHRTRSIWY